MRTCIVVVALICVAPTAFAGAPPDNTLAKRWENAYQTELKQAAAMYEEGDPISRPQMYELARTATLRQLHSRLDMQLEKKELTPSEYVILKAVFNALAQCNPPGGCDLSCFQGIDSRKAPVALQDEPASAQPSRIAVRTFLMSRTNETDLSSSVVSFLVGTPYSWETFSKRLSAGDWQDEALRLAEETSEILTAAAKLFGMLADDFPGAVPPAVRANFIENAGTKEQPKPQDIVDSIKAYETYGLTYGTDGWQGLVKTFLDETKHDTASIDNFAVFLEKSNIVFQNVKLANHGGDHAATATEKTLDSIFTEASIFSVP